MTTERFFILLGTAIAILALGMFTLSSVFSNDDTLERCILHELNEHRVNAFDADRDNAVAHEHSFDVPRPPAKDLSERAALERACGDVLDGLD